MQILSAGGQKYGDTMQLQSLRIGPFIYTIEFVENLESDFETVDGELEHGAQIIRLEEKHTDAYKLLVLLHEVTHALLEQSGQRQRFDHDDQEAICDMIGYGVFQVLRDNRWLTELFLGNFEKKEDKKEIFEYRYEMQKDNARVFVMPSGDVGIECGIGGTFLLSPAEWFERVEQWTAEHMSTKEAKAVR